LPQEDRRRRLREESTGSRDWWGIQRWGRGEVDVLEKDGGDLRGEKLVGEQILLRILRVGNEGAIAKDGSGPESTT
jgi:hypothetical protein